MLLANASSQNSHSATSNHAVRSLLRPQWSRDSKVMLKAICYARFHPERGISVVHQYPANSIVASRSSGASTLFSFQDISSYVIPPYELCNRPLSICTNGCRLLGFPISLEDAKYARNRFTFNVCFVVDENEDVRSWDPVVRKTAKFFQALEEEEGVLQDEEQLEGLKWADEELYPVKGVGVVYTLLQSILEDLNGYAEACVRVGDVHVLNLRLTPTRPAAPKVRAWDVPLLIRPLPSKDEWTWDLTLQRIHEHIDGVKHVQRIAEVADVELKLVKKAVRELLYHERVTLLDIFHFQAIYAQIADFAWFVKDEAMQEECCKYIAIDPGRKHLSSGQHYQKDTTPPTKQVVVDLYRDLSSGISLQDFSKDHQNQLSNIDRRRFITFGILKGFLRRIHKYPLAVDSSSTSSQPALPDSPMAWKPTSHEDSVKEIERAWKQAALSSGWPTPPVESQAESVETSSVKSVIHELPEVDEKLKKYLDGTHCMDEICVSMHLSEKKVIEKLHSGRFGEVVLLCK